MNKIGIGVMSKDEKNNIYTYLYANNADIYRGPSY